MPRFRIRSLLLLTTAVCLWLATFSGEADPSLQGPGSHFRRVLLATVLIASAVAAVSSSGHRRAFWSAFAAMMLLIMTVILGGYSRPDVGAIARSWIENLQGIGLSRWLQTLVYCAFRDGLVLVCATFAGIVSAFVYDQIRKTNET
jgi:hypothetical protein